jgi:hypothetical protein
MLQKAGWQRSASGASPRERSLGRLGINPLPADSPHEFVDSSTPGLS